jgi:hypothetical protein
MAVTMKNAVFWGDTEDATLYGQSITEGGEADILMHRTRSSPYKYFSLGKA